MTKAADDYKAIADRLKQIKEAEPEAENKADEPVSTGGKGQVWGPNSSNNWAIWDHDPMGLWG